MMFDFFPDQIETEFISDGQSSFSDYGNAFFPGDFFLQNAPTTQSSNVQQQQQQQQLSQVQSGLINPAMMISEEPSPALSGSSAVTSPESSPTSDYGHSINQSPESKSVEDEEEDEESDSEESSGSDLSDSDSDSDSDSEEEKKSKQRPRKIPAKRRRITKSSSDTSDKQQAQTQQQRKKRAKKIQPAPPDPALPAGHPLPAILGGEMPAPLRRKRRKDMTEEEMKKKEAEGIPPEEDSDSEERRMVRLPRKTLLVMTSAQIGQYIKYIRAKFTLTRGQIEELRRQKRLVKNRESAKSSRKKREALVSELQKSIAQMQSSLEALKKDNERLANENIRLRSVLKMRDPALFDSVLHDSDAASGKMVDADSSSKAANSNSSGRPTVRVASLVFFFIVFCFALFCQVSVLQTRAGSAVDIPRTVPRSTWKREMIPEVSHRFSESKPLFSSRKNGRVFKDTNDQRMCQYNLPDIEPSGTWKDGRGGLTIRRPTEWAQESNLTYLYVARDSYLSQMGAVSRQFMESENGALSFSVVVPLDAIQPSCCKRDTTKNDVFVDVRCSVEEISIIPDNVQIPGDRLD